MFRKFVFPLLLAATAAAAEPIGDGCTGTGLGVEFCGGTGFARIDKGQYPGQSFWLHRGGYFSKLLVQRDDASVTPTQIEAMILQTVSGQATRIGRDFEFGDLEARSIGGVPMGTLSYTLSTKGASKAILHSYVATGEVVIQVLSQHVRQPENARESELLAAHEAALSALRIGVETPEI